MGKKTFFSMFMTMVRNRGGGAVGNDPNVTCAYEALGLFQKLSWGAAFFSDPSTPRTHMESEPPDPQDT